MKVGLFIELILANFIIKMTINIDRLLTNLNKCAIIIY